MAEHAPASADHGHGAAEKAPDKANGPEKKKAETIGGHAAETKSKVHDALGDGNTHNAHTSVPTSHTVWKPLPAAPKLSTVGKAAIAGLTVAAPPLGIATGIGVLGGSKLWGKAKKYPPFSWVDKGVRNTGNLALSGLSGAWEVGTYPLRVAGRLGANTVRGIGRAAHTVLDYTVLELYRDVRMAVNHKYDFPENTNPLAAFLTMVKGMGLGLVSLPGRAMAAYGHAWMNKPLPTFIAHILAVGLMQQAGGIVPAAGKVVDAILKLIQGAGSALGAI